jgi:hypothetical protein
MTETLFRKSWQPLAEADKSEPKLVRHVETGEVLRSLYRWEAGGWCAPDHAWMIFPENVGLFEFLCLEPVEVETGEFPKVI